MATDGRLIPCSAAREQNARARLSCVYAMRRARRMPGQLKDRLPILVMQLDHYFPTISVNRTNLYRWDKCERHSGFAALIDRRGLTAIKDDRHGHFVAYAALRCMCGVEPREAARHASLIALDCGYPLVSAAVLNDWLFGKLLPIVAPQLPPPPPDWEHPGLVPHATPDERAECVAAGARVLAWEDRTPGHPQKPRVCA